MGTEEYLSKHLSADKIEVILSYLKEHNCVLQFKNPRKSKRGDFRVQNSLKLITINQDENSFRLLFTLVHEIAHLKTYNDYKHTVKPHGIEWKNNFRLLFAMFSMEEEFSANKLIHVAAMRELQNPKASSGVSLELEKAFRLADKQESILLNEISIGSHFIFRGVEYKKEANRRSRALCTNLSNQKKYTINVSASVQITGN